MDRREPGFKVSGNFHFDFKRQWNVHIMHYGAKNYISNFVEIDKVRAPAPVLRVQIYRCSDGN